MKEKLDAFGERFDEMVASGDPGGEACAAYLYVTKGAHPTMRAAGCRAELLGMLISLGYAMAMHHGLDYRDLVGSMCDVFEENPPKGMTLQ